MTPAVLDQVERALDLLIGNVTAPHGADQLSGSVEEGGGVSRPKGSA